MCVVTLYFYIFCYFHVVRKYCDGWVHYYIVSQISLALLFPVNNGAPPTPTPWPPRSLLIIRWRIQVCFHFWYVSESYLIWKNQFKKITILYKSLNEVCLNLFLTRWFICFHVHQFTGITSFLSPCRSCGLDSIKSDLVANIFIHWAIWPALLLLLRWSLIVCSPGWPWVCGAGPDLEL